MNFDLRLPIGLMFSLFGAILTIFGLISDRELYRTHSLGININLLWGIVLLLFGIFMLALALRSRAQRAAPSDKNQPTATGPETSRK